MDNQLNKFLSPRVIFIGVFLLAVLFWYAVFSIVGSNDSSSESTDKLSGMSYYQGAVNDGYGANPYVPYFTGFDNLTKYGYTADDRRYVQDVITNFVLYDLKNYRAKVGFVKDSFKQELGKTIDLQTSFKFGVNDSNVHTVKVSTNFITKDITISIFDSNNSQVFTKSFTEHSS